ncbi:MAG: hypothetical protein KGS72_21925 [Cyanobacteria bacterium REEB67]|nr:hypothetical protein [Cyanobacteria bacterium REEB67]
MALGDANAGDSSLNIQPDTSPAHQQEAAANGRFQAEAMPALGAPMSIAGLSSPEYGSFSLVGGTGSDLSDNPNSPYGKLDKSKTVGQLIDAGVIKPVDASPVRVSGASDATVAAAQILQPGEAPQVTLTYTDAPNQGQQPDFIVKQDGTIEASGDPAAANKKDIVIQVERAPGSVANPDAVQQQSIDGLVNYLYGRMSDNPAVAKNGFQLNDQFGLLSGDVSKEVSRPDLATASAADTAAQRHNFAPQTQQAMSQASRFTPGSSGTMSRSDMSNYVPERTEARVKDETQSVADIKNAIAAEFRPDVATKANPNAPYETSRMDRVGATMQPAVGRYGMTFQLFRGWFATNLGVDDDLDDDNIEAKMDALAKKGKVSKEFAAKFHNKEFAHRFVHAMHEMKDGHPPSRADMHDLMPPQFQEQVAADMVSKFAQTSGGDTGKTALAFHLGKEPGQLSADELADKGNKEYMQTANKFGQISHLRDGMGANDTADYTVSKDGSMLDAKIKKAAMSVANSIGGADSQGRCAEGVQLAWARAGYSELLGSGDGWQMHHTLDRDPKFVKVDRETALQAVRDGHVAIVTRHWSVDHNGKDSGHVETLMAGNNGSIIGASDFYGAHNPNNQRYNKDFYYLPKADLQNA